MMIKCQKCGFENQMGSIFCRECGEKLDMDAIDPNKLQKDVNKEKNIKLAKKRIKEAISSGIALIIVLAFLAVVFYNGGLRKYEEPSVSEASARQKYNAAISRTEPGKVKYSYPEVNRMFKDMVVDPIAKESSFATVTAAEISFDEEKQKPVIYLWLTLKDKVPVIYTIHGDINFHARHGSADEESTSSPLTVDVSRLDIGRLPLFVSTHTFLEGFSSLLNNDKVQSFFDRATNVDFTAEGMTVEFGKAPDDEDARPAPRSTSASAPSTSKTAPSSAPAKAALKGSATNEKDEAARRKAEEEEAKKKQVEEERKRKAEEYKQQQKQKEEERKRKAEEEKKKREQEAEERKRKQEEENERRRQEREDRRRDRDNNRYNSSSSRSSRSSRSSSRNRY